MTQALRIGPREADMIADGLVSLSGDWEDQDVPPTSADEERMRRLFRKLAALRALRDEGATR